MNRMCLRVWVLSMVMQSVSCASEHTDSGDHQDVAGKAAEAQSAGAAGAAPIGECHWPSSLASLGTQTRDVCVATRAYLMCSSSIGGGGVWCPSTDAISCANPVEPEFHVSSCTSDCGADEYVAICGGVGPGRVPEPPSGCRFDSANPGGSVTYCCPCD